MKDKPETTRKELAKLIEISIDGIKYHIQKMTKEGSLNTKAKLKQVNGLFSWSKYVEIGETLYQLGDTKSTLLRTLIINKKK